MCRKRRGRGWELGKITLARKACKMVGAAGTLAHSVNLIFAARLKPRAAEHIALRHMLGQSLRTRTGHRAPSVYIKLPVVNCGARC